MQYVFAFLKNILLEMLQAPVTICSYSLGVMHTLNRVSPSHFTVRALDLTL